MDHETAVREDVAIKYVSQRLDMTTKHAFEEHYFDCAKCAEDVEILQIVAANTRAVLRDERAPVVTVLTSGFFGLFTGVFVYKLFHQRRGS